MVNLTEIDVSYNKLTRIPEPIYRLEKLKRAKFCNNEISEMSSLTGYLFFVVVKPMVIGGASKVSRENVFCAVVKPTVFT